MRADDVILIDRPTIGYFLPRDLPHLTPQSVHGLYHDLMDHIALRHDFTPEGEARAAGAAMYRFQDSIDKEADLDLPPSKCDRGFVVLSLAHQIVAYPMPATPLSVPFDGCDPEAVDEAGKAAVYLLEFDQFRPLHHASVTLMHLLAQGWTNARRAYGTRRHARAQHHRARTRLEGLLCRAGDHPTVRIRYEPLTLEVMP